MLLHTVLLGITSVVSVAAAPASDPSDCGWKILFPYIPCVDVPDVPPHGSNETTSAQNCYQSAHTGACVYCGHWEGASALMDAETGQPDSVCATGYCDFKKNGDLACLMP